MGNETINILLIEDEQLAVEVLVQLLETTDKFIAKVDHAPTLLQGLSMLERGSYQIVLLDLNLPDSLGVDTVKEVHSKAPDIAIVVMTGTDDEETAVMSLHEGAQDFLVKGQYDLELLIRSIRYSLQRKYFQEELNATHAQMLQSEKMASIGQLAAGVAHEINNPVGFVTSNLNTFEKYINRIQEFLEDQSAVVQDIDDVESLGRLAERRKKLNIDYILDDSKQLIQESLEGTERVKRIVQDLKNFSRADAQQKPCFEKINELLESSLNVVWNELKYKASIIKELGDIPPVQCYCQQLNQIFVNLLVNAGQAIEKQGEITIRTRLENSFVCISISDSGCGISEKNLFRIFDPFFTTKDVGQGTGLGLSIVHEIVTKKHNGMITAESEEGKGTTFIIKLPVKIEC